MTQMRHSRKHESASYREHRQMRSEVASDKASHCTKSSHHEISRKVTKNPFGKWPTPKFLTSSYGPTVAPFPLNLLYICTIHSVICQRAVFFLDKIVTEKKQKCWCDPAHYDAHCRTHERNP